LDIVAGRITRVQESIKKPRPDRDELQHELQALLPMQETLERGESLRQLTLTQSSAGPRRRSSCLGTSHV